MAKNNIIELINRIFCPNGYKRAGNHWKQKSNDITKVLTLRKSSYGNVFYINPNIIINDLPLNESTTHVSIGANAKSLFELAEQDASDSTILSEMKDSLNIILGVLKDINSEAELLEYIKNKMNPNAIPLIVKKHFNLPL